LLTRADWGLSPAKAGARRRYRFCAPPLPAAFNARPRLDTELRTALAEHEFALVYQPVVDLASNTVVGMEGLLRWHHPLSGLIPPANSSPWPRKAG
jgi:predicted signal transduction protein with EAL and GGDEF domain